MFVKQVSVFMENRPGRLAEITDVLSKNNVDIRAINIADTTDFGILRLINFAHGSIFAFGSYMVFLFYSLGVPMIPAILIALVLSGLLAFGMDKITLEPLRKKNSETITYLITTVGVSFIIQNTLSVQYVFTSERQVFPSTNVFPPISIGNVTIQSSQLIMFVVALILLVILTLVVNKTKMGLAMRATEQNSKAAKLMGVNVNRVIAFTFFMGGASAAIAGIYKNVCAPNASAKIHEICFFTICFSAFPPDSC